LNDEHRPRIISTPPAAPAPKERKVLREETFEVIENATPKDVITLMARVAKLLNHHIADILRSELVGCANPGSNAMSNASAALEQGAIQFEMLIRQQQQNAFAGPGGPQPMPGGFRTN
jgi:hypothetical protein